MWKKPKNLRQLTPNLSLLQRRKRFRRNLRRNPSQSLKLRQSRNLLPRHPSQLKSPRKHRLKRAHQQRLNLKLSLRQSKRPPSK